MTDDFFRRCGRFSVTSYMLTTHTDELLEQVFRRTAIVRAECMYHNDMVEYTAYCAEFDPIEPGVVPPFYQALFTRHDDGSITIAWSRQS